MIKLLYAVALILVASGVTFAQQDPDDPGMQDSLIVDSVHVDQGATFAFVRIYAVTDDSVAFFNIPLGWFPHGDNVRRIVVDYFWPVDTWGHYDTLMLDEGFIRLLGWIDIGPDTAEQHDFLFTDGVRLHIITLRFALSPDALPQVIRLDTLWDGRNGSIWFGLADGVHEITPGFRYGQIVIGEPVGGEEPAGPYSYFLDQNYPNPFNAATTIRYDLPQPLDVRIEIYDILGRKIETLAEGMKPAGNQLAIWDGSGRSSGIYFYRIKADDKVETKKMTLMK